MLENLLGLFEILRESYVWIPCYMAASESGEIHLVPDILENMEGNFFPVFSNERAMGEYGKDFIHVKRNMPDAIRLARCNALKPSVIILNPFTRALEIPEELWHTLEK